jgi:acrylyl-CoA reductase (NADPH)
MENFRALVVEKVDKGSSVGLRELTLADLPAEDVLIEVAYSGINYKDALAVMGKGQIIRTWPLVPGIDLAGTVVESVSPEFAPGTEVVLTGWGVGERYWGGYSRYARVRPEWLVRKPEGLSLRQAMEIGTGGFTAMLCVMALQANGLEPGEAEVLVTGASGGVGSYSVALLSSLGYKVVAVTGRSENHSYLKDLGAKSVIGRDAVSPGSGKPLESQRWAGAIDSVGGTMLAELLKAVNYGGSVAACGLAGGSELDTSVFPFILRGIKLLGVESALYPKERRAEVWRRLATDLPASAFDRITRVVRLDEVPTMAQELLDGKVRGRILVDLT